MPLDPFFTSATKLREPPLTSRNLRAFELAIQTERKKRPYGTPKHQFTRVSEKVRHRSAINHLEEPYEASREAKKAQFEDEQEIAKIARDDHAQGIAFEACPFEQSSSAARHWKTHWQTADRLWRRSLPSSP